MIDFAALPPEINSARMYLGPGSAPMLAAASAWNTMAAEMRSTAASYESVISALTSESWFGPSSTSMAAAATTYLAWLSTTAAQAEQAGSQANAAATAYESAFGMTVPPATVTANRTQLAALVASNSFGQNTPAIATTEAQYAEMWAQDAAAMYGYAGASSAATQLTPFTDPQSGTNPEGVAAQSAAAAQNNTSSASSTSTSLSGLMSQLGEVIAPGSNADTTGLSGLLNDLDGSNGALLGSFISNATFANFTNAFTTSGLLNPTAFIDSVTAYSYLFGATGEGGALSDLAAGLGQANALGFAGLPGLAGSVSAEMGQANLLGALSVPSQWATTGAKGLAAAALPGHGLLGATPMVMEDVGPVGLPGVPLGGMAGMAEDEMSNAPVYGFKLQFLARPPAAG